MSVVKSGLIKNLSSSYPNFLKKDLVRIFDIAIYEIRESLKRGERVELREVFSFEPRVQKARVSRNPKTNEKINTPEKKSVLFKMSREWAKKINEKK
ncbi:MAG: HU family DNA-binding protein [Candidatus Pelagibacter sp.]|nr:integration host factor subunit beta [Pelagibacterales bacterium SAG-MED23]